MEQKPLRILVADDERDLVWALQHILADEGYEVLTAYDGLQALTLARSQRPDLIILDVIMPGLDGFAVCHMLRQDRELATIPVLFLTVRGDIEDRLAGLDGGSDDYLVKPFDARELQARIRAVLRRSRFTAPQSKSHLLTAGSLTLDLHTHQVRVEEKTVQLTPCEFNLLHYLMAYAGQVFSSAALLEAVWGYTSGAATPALVRWHVKNLRAKIEPDPAHPIYIRTVQRHGYIFMHGT